MPTVREPDGLAMSSRNEYLTPEGRAHAVCLYEALERARRAFRDGEHSGNELVRLMRRTIERRPGVQLQYAQIVDPATLQSCEQARLESVAVLAVFVDGVRLIDNMVLG